MDAILSNPANVVAAAVVVYLFLAATGRTSV